MSVWLDEQLANPVAANNHFARARHESGFGLIERDGCVEIAGVEMLHATA